MTDQSGNRRMTASEVRQHFSEVVNSVARGDGQVIVQKNGTPAVAIVPIEEVRELKRLRDANPEQAVEIARRRIWAKEMQAFFAQFPQDELQQAIDDSVAEVKREMREERRRQRAAESEVPYSTKGDHD